ncbi:hypothetical protein LTEGF4_25850 (plasmid) [Limnohabitans sp. TEGF004]|nr:hypothetical protein LTEGF4_25850 [Limnohabitans sp. TEGF004]
MNGMSVVARNVADFQSVKTQTCLGVGGLLVLYSIVYLDYIQFKARAMYLALGIDLTSNKQSLDSNL